MNENEEPIALRKLLENNITKVNQLNAKLMVNDEILDSEIREEGPKFTMEDIENDRPF